MPTILSGFARRSPAVAGRRRVSYSGNTLAFQAKAGSSILPTRSKTMKKVLIITGSKNDIFELSEIKKLFRKEKTDFDIKVISAHRNIKELVIQLETNKLEESKIGVILAVAHSVANLPAIVAGYLKNTKIPVLGVGLTKTSADSLESLFSVISIPKGIPLMNTGINKVGLYNAALCCIKLLKPWSPEYNVVFCLMSKQKTP